MAALVISVTACAQMAVPAQLQAALFYKIFDFDETLSSSSGPITIGIYYDPNNSASQEGKDAIEQAFLDLSNQTVAGRHVLIKSITDLGQIRGLDIVYVTPGNDSVIKEIVKACEANKIFGISGTEAYAQMGLPVAIGAQNNKPKIIVNRSQAAICGVKLSSKLLALARLI